LETIILLDETYPILENKETLLKNNNTKIFSFNIDVHNQLTKQKIEHEIADNLLVLNERLELFSKSLEFLSQYSNASLEEMNFEGVNLLKIFDSHEFHSYLMPVLLNLIIIKKIIDKEKPKKIISTFSLSETVKSITNNTDIQTDFFSKSTTDQLLWEKITIKYNFGKIPLTFNLSRKNYFRIKNFIESSLGNLFRLWFSSKINKKKSIIFLEFNPQLFSNLFESLKKYDGNILLINQRRSAIWSKKSLDIVRKSNCKIVNFENYFNSSEKNEIINLNKKYTKKIKKLTNYSIFNKIFQIDGINFWSIIHKTILQLQSDRLNQYISLIYCAKKIFSDTDVKCLVSLNETGETEKAFLEFNNSKSPSILLEHGFIERIDKTKRYDILSDYVSFKDKIAVWGEKKKNWLINEYNIDPNKIIVTGSPRHDQYFHSKKENKIRQEKIILLAPNPINDINGLSSTELKQRFNQTLINTLSIIKKFENVKIIVKLHPIQLKHNDEIKSLIKEFDKTIPIYLWTSVIDTINNADVVLVISPEINSTPTMLLESMILGKPTMNIYFDKTIPLYEHVKNNTILTILDTDDLEKNLKKLLFDTHFQINLKNNADDFLKKFLNYPGTSSKKLASILNEY